MFPIWDAPVKRVLLSSLLFSQCSLPFEEVGRVVGKGMTFFLQMVPFFVGTGPHLFEFYSLYYFYELKYSSPFYSSLPIVDTGTVYSEHLNVLDLIFADIK